MSDGATNEFEDDLPLVGYLITVSEILRYEGREAWADNISKAASKINKMQKEIESLRRQLEPLTTFASAESVTQLRAENEKLRAALAFYADDKNWRLNGPLDTNSGNFTGGPAQEIVER